MDGKHLDNLLRSVARWRSRIVQSWSNRQLPSDTRTLHWEAHLAIERLILLRLCEDRNLATQGTLESVFTQPGIDRSIVGACDEAIGEQFREAAPFMPRAQPFAIDDELWHTMATELSTICSKGGAIPAEILGLAYEQHLALVQQSTDVSQHSPHRNGKSQRKAGGVYYTPRYVVDFMVRETVGRWMNETASQNEVVPISIADPACGCGSFLLGAFRFLVRWHAEQSSSRRRPDAQPAVRANDLRRPSTHKPLDLFEYLHGVDVDPHACVRCRLALALEMIAADAVTKSPVENRKQFERARAIAAENIKCGNALLGVDAARGEDRHIDWPMEFSAVFARQPGGFDVVIGNPPWGGDIDRHLEYFHAEYPESTKAHTDSFKLFIEGSIRWARTGGLVALLVPGTLLRQGRLRDVRSLLLQHQLTTIVDLGENVFKGVTAPACIFVARKSPADVSNVVQMLPIGHLTPVQKQRVLKPGSGAEGDRTTASSAKRSQRIEQRAFAANEGSAFVMNRFSGTAATAPLRDVPGLSLRDAGINYQRVRVGRSAKGRGTLGARLLYTGRRRRASDQMFYKGVDIDRYWIAPSTQRYCRTDISKVIQPGEIVRLNEAVYRTRPKILLRQTADRLIAALDDRGCWFGRSLISLVPDDALNGRPEYILALLNSSTLSWMYRRLSGEPGRTFAQVKLATLRQLPIRTMDPCNSTDIAYHDRLVDCVCQIQDVKRAENRRRKRQRRSGADASQSIARLESVINETVHQLYGLDDETILEIEREARRQHTG